jgi:enamine deaminase RidA (YjgF/YER057c/UK114 family)
MTFYVMDINDFDTIHRVRSEFFPERPFPASAMVQISRLVDARYLIEADAVAVIPSTTTSGAAQ